MRISDWSSDVCSSDLIEEGATLEAGGPGRPDGVEIGYFVKPTLFSNVRNDMTIAREEIFGPVVTIIPYEDDEDAIRIANDTDYGLSEIARASCRERVCQYVYISVFAVSLQKNLFFFLIFSLLFYYFYLFLFFLFF